MLTDVTCRHPLCELIGGACSLATHRSRGCRPNAFAKSVAPDVFVEVRALLAVIDPETRTEQSQLAATRLAQIVRREALEERNLIAHAREDEPELAEPLARLCARR
jgi:hypothetical protein